LDDSKKIEELIDEFFGVKIENNKNCNISHNKIGTNDKTIIYNSLNTEYYDNELSEISSRTNETLNNTKDNLISGKLNRVIKNVDIFSRFLFDNQNKTRKPTVRTYGLFSNLSTNRDQSTSSDDYNLLVLEEKTLLETFIKHGYSVKVCISLDIDLIFDVWGYNTTQLKQRIINLCSNLLILENLHKNLTVSFDTHNRIDNTFILGDSILIRAITASSGQGYNTTHYEENKYIVDRAIKTFDDIFNLAKQRDYQTRKQLQIDNIKVYIELLFEQRLKATKLCNQ
jgi:hypothetical protein